MMAISEAVAATACSNGGGAGEEGNGTHAQYWWTHDTLRHEVPTPDLTGVEAAMTILQEIRSVTEEQVVAHTAELMAHVTQEEGRRREVAQGNNGDEECQESKTTNAKWRQWSAFLPDALCRLHTAFAQTWRERAGGADANAHSEAEVVVVAQGEAAADRNATRDAQPRQELREVERLVYTSFFRAVLQGLRSAVWRVVQTSSTEDDEAETGTARHDRFSTLLGILLDGLLGQLCFPPPSSSTSTMSCEVNSRMCFHAHTYLKQELRLSPVERAAYLPRLAQQARHTLEHELSSWLDTQAASQESSGDKARESVSEVTFVRRSVDYMRACFSGLRCRDEARLFYEYDESSEASRLPCQKWLALALLLPMTTRADAAWLLAWLQRWLHAVHACLARHAESNGREGEAAGVMQRLYGRVARHAMQAIPLLAHYPACALSLGRLVELFASAFYGENALGWGEATHASRRRCLRQCHALLMQQQQQQQQQMMLSNGAAANNNLYNYYPEIEKGRTFAEACRRRVLYSLARLQHSPAAATAAAAPHHASAEPLWQSAESVAALAYALLLSPLSTLCTLVRHALTSQSVRLHCSADGVFAERGSGGSSGEGAAGKSAARARAYEEQSETVMTHAALLELFFPRFVAVFAYLEHALHYLLARLTEQSAGEDEEKKKEERTHLVHYVAACLDEAFWLGLSDCDESEAVAASELLMFYALLCNNNNNSAGHKEGDDDEHVSSIDELPLVRAAVRGFFGPTEAQMLRYVHEGVVGRKLYGLLGFFVPLLRSLGTEASSCTVDPEHRAALALRFPLSARVAFLQELPRLYFCAPRAGVSLARTAAEDALAFLHRMLFADATSNEEEGREDKMTRVRFVELLVRAGTRVAGRVLSSSSAGVAADENGVGNDVTAAFFFGVMRLCRAMGAETNEAVALLHESERQKAINTTEAAPGNEAQRVTPTRAQWEQLHEELLQACGTTDTARLVRYVWPDSKHEESAQQQHEEEEGKDTAAQAADAAAAVATKEDENNKKTLPQDWLRCFWQVDYCDIEEEEDEREHEGPQPTLQAAKALLRSCTVSYAQHLSPKTLLELRALFEQAGTEQRRHESAPGSHTPRRQLLSEAVVHDLRALAPSSSSTSTTTGTSSTPLRLTDIEPYMRALSGALLARSCMSVSDALCAARALRLFLATAAAQQLVEGGALVHVLWRFVYAVTLRLRQATHAEAVALSTVLHDLIEHVILPYKLSFAGKQQDNKKNEDEEGTTTKEAGARRTRWYSDEESDANQLLQNAMSDCSKALVALLTRHTLLTDWCAYVVAWHCRAILGLVTRYHSAVHNAIAERRALLGRTKVLSPGFLSLSKVDYPLAPGMSGRASEVRQLYVADTPAQTKTSPPAAATKTTAQQQQQQQQQTSSFSAANATHGSRTPVSHPTSRYNTPAATPSQLTGGNGAVHGSIGGRGAEVYSRHESSYGGRGEYERRSSYYGKRERDVQEGSKENEERRHSSHHHSYRNTVTSGGSSRRYEEGGSSAAAAAAKGSSERHRHGRSRHGSRSRRGEGRSRR